MNSAELKQRLVEAGVPEEAYFIIGIDERHGSKGASMGELMIRPDDASSDWLVFIYERGERTNLRRYATEEEAAEEVWEQLRSIPTTPTVVLTPEERAASLERGRSLAERGKARLTARPPKQG